MRDLDWKLIKIESKDHFWPILGAWSFSLKSDHGFIKLSLSKFLIITKVEFIFEVIAIFKMIIDNIYIVLS